MFKQFLKLVRIVNNVLIGKRHKFQFDTSFSESQKIFVIGLNKTGTTTIREAFKMHDIPVGHQGTAEYLLENYRKKDYKTIFDYTKTAVAFQDIPFSIPGFYKLLSQWYPNAKFILSIRSSPEQWYSSISKFHSKRFGKNGRIPTGLDLLKSEKKYTGWIYLAMKTIFPKGKLYDESYYMSVYENHTQEVSSHFSSNQNQLLVLNVEEQDAYMRFCEFIESRPLRDSFPWCNKTSEVN